MNLNKPVLEHIVKMGGDSATVSDAARAWLEIKAHYEGLSRNDMARISTTPAVSLTQVQASVAKRADDGLTDAHYLALFLDPRPSMRAFVQHSGLLGSAADKTLGNTEALTKARAALKCMSAAAHVTGKSKDEVGKALSTALSIYLEVGCHAAVCCVCNACCAACLLCPYCLQVRCLWRKECKSALWCSQVHPDIARSKLKITDELLAQHGDDDSPVAFWQLSCPHTCLLREPALRILCAKAAALGVERLWSAARITLTDNRRLIKTARLMQLLQLKLNMGLLEDSAFLDSMCVKLVEDNFAFESIFEDVVSFDEEERAAEAAQLVQEDTGIWSLESEENEGEGGEKEEDLDLFA
jgi:hypothetical protein